MRTSRNYQFTAGLLSRCLHGQRSTACCPGEPSSASKACIPALQLHDLLCVHQASPLRVTSVMLNLHQLLLLPPYVQASPYAMALAAGQLRLRCAVAALLLLCAAVPAEPALTFQDVRRIALASSGSAPPGANQRLATADGLAKAKALNIPINERAIAEHPALAQVCESQASSRHGVLCRRAAGYHCRIGLRARRLLA